MAPLARQFCKSLFKPQMNLIIRPKVTKLNYVLCVVVSDDISIETFFCLNRSSLRYAEQYFDLGIELWYCSQSTDSLSAVDDLKIFCDELIGLNIDLKRGAYSRHTIVEVIEVFRL